MLIEYYTLCFFYYHQKESSTDCDITEMWF